MGTAKGVFGAQRPYKELCLSQCCFHWDKWETFVLQDQPYGCIHKSESCVPSAPVAYRTVLLLCPFHVGVDVPGNSFIAVVFIYRWCCSLKNTAGAFLHRSSWMWTLSRLTNLNLCKLFQYLLCAEKKTLHSSFCMTVGTHHTWSFMGCTESFQSSAWHLDNKSPFSSDGNWTSEMPMWFQNSVYVDWADLALLPCLCNMITWLGRWEEGQAVIILARIKLALFVLPLKG